MKPTSSPHSLHWETKQPKKKFKLALKSTRSRSENPDSIYDLKSGTLAFFYGMTLLATIFYFYYLNSTAIHEMIFGKKKPQAAEVVEPF